MPIKLEQDSLQDEIFSRTVLDSLYDGILVVDDQLRVLYCNEAYREMYGISLLKIWGKNLNWLLENQYVDRSFTHLVKKIKKKISYHQRTKAGRTVLNISIPILDQEKNLKYIVENCKHVEAIDKLKDMVLDEPPGVNTAKKKNVKKPYFSSFQSEAMQSVYQIADNMASKNINMLILGNSGTGKTQIARRIHENSSRSSRPFITINCSTIPENLMESELFGYQRGAFSGASEKGKQGLVELADGGTLFLDEIGEIPLFLQSKLLELVQEKTFLPIGGVTPKSVDTRIIAATNKDILELISQKKFREDLYYRLAVATVHMPPLKGRKEDILQLLSLFANFYNEKHDTDVSFSKEVKGMLCDYSWPGNIRELEHLVEFLILNVQTGYVLPSHLPANMMHLHKKDSKLLPAVFEPEDGSGLAERMEAVERRIVQDCYQQWGSSYKVSEKLKISQTKANRLIQKYCR